MFLFQCKSLILLFKKNLIEVKSIDVSHTHSSSLTFPYSNREFKNQSVKFLYIRNGKKCYSWQKKICAIVFIVFHFV